ncbi:12224_t:CDS:10 [Dentiscutata erythropus]|uniref:12224_t:CDS:1 n=1 Tax=Dentiscutata erythropus TaxID=1348616 RepID=A0A9N9CC47_9GLOM|nr:12224_t:CDS:10 [Dentiscutata erythropus]
MEKEKSKYRYSSEIQQMMFVFGEVPEPLTETIQLVEDIVRSQVIEIIIQAAAQAAKRGSRYMSSEDLIFLIRHDRAKVNRLRTYLSWKDVRKNVKDTGNDAVEETIEEPSAAYNDSIQRLKDADEITRAMTREEYVHYSECRQASFTYRKAKRFREWANMSAYIDMKPNDDIIDILGFLTFEMVSTLTETALRVKRDLDKDQKMHNKGLKRPRENYDTGGNVFLFSLPPPEQTALQPSHIHEAFRRLQMVAQLYSVAEASKAETSGGEGVEVIKNESYDNGKELWHPAERLNFTKKRGMPTLIVRQNGYMKENFKLITESMHIDESRGEVENALNISEDLLEKRKVVIIDVANDPIEAKDYQEDEDPTLFHSEKTGRGPLKGDWIKTVTPVMTCYKLVTIEFKWFGLQTKMEAFTQDFHRQVFCWTDKWFGMTLEDIRELEDKTKLDLDESLSKPLEVTEATETVVVKA